MRVVDADGPHGGPPASLADGTDGGPAYEVMYLLRDSDEERVGHPARRRSTGWATPLLVVGGPDLWNVHVHVDDVGRRRSRRASTPAAPTASG